MEDEHCQCNMSQAELYDCCDPEVTGEGVQWAYSTCTGNKKALLVGPLLAFTLPSRANVRRRAIFFQIGINYVGMDPEVVLKGCVNDALNLRKFITGMVFWFRWGPTIQWPCREMGL